MICCRLPLLLSLVLVGTFAAPTFLANPPTQCVVRDTFTTASLSNDEGTVEWSSDWDIFAGRLSDVTIEDGEMRIFNHDHSSPLARRTFTAPPYSTKAQLKISFAINIAEGESHGVSLGMLVYESNTCKGHGILEGS